MENRGNIKIEFEKVKAVLEGLEKPILEESRKLFIKNRILSKIDAPVASFVRSSADKVQLGFVERASIKERVFAFIEANEQKRFSLRNLLVLPKRLMSGALMFVMAFGMFSFVNVETGVVMADTFTTLDAFDGDVVVERNGDYVSVEVGMSIFEKDKVLTGDGASATVRYFDDSISRLSENTEVVVNKLFRPAGSMVRSYVEISIEKGVVWSKVVNLVERSSSFVVVADDVYFSTQKGAFNIDLDEANFELGVYNNVVEVRNAGDVEIVLSGEKIVFDIESNLGKITDMSEGEREIAWVEDNMEDDMKHVDDIEEEVLLAKSDIDTGLREKTLVFLTFDDVKKQKLQLDLAEEEFVAAQFMLENEELNEEEMQEVEVAFDSFVIEVEEFYELIDEVEETDSKYAVELETYVEEKVFNQKKVLSLTSPDSEIYEAKEIVEELELLAVDEVEEVVEIKVVQALTTLSEVEEAIINEDEELAVRVIDEYNEDLEEVIAIIEGSDEDAEVKEALTEDVIEAITDVVEEDDYGVVIQGDKPLPPLLSL